MTAPEYQQDDRSGMSLSVETVPGSVPYTVRTVIRPDGTVTTRRYEGIVSDLPLHWPSSPLTFLSTDLPTSLRASGPQTVLRQSDRPQ